ncbi:hypothetical protein [Maliponia aquimaris]|uniref:Methyl-accepting chemotaxis protein 4 n=1 Tax=Maliponia aquimaris TaxID=1673631 RepID=A0A238K1P2_9RHOB|nr:hypothetical protein [Maliponia aquimaris]SMX36284.1 hypothetical protein MAA8898_00814 [Maliponia aquimaris]
MQLRELSQVGQQTLDLSVVGVRMQASLHAMVDMAEAILAQVQGSVRMIREAGHNSQALAEWVRAVHAGGTEVEDMLRTVPTSNTLISDIAWQMHILAVNAKIEAARRCFTLTDTSEPILQHAVALGGNGEDGVMITRVQDLSGQVALVMEQALADGRITEDALFARIYAPIPHSDLKQVLAPFTRLTDDILPPIQEPALMLDDRIVFCAAVDQNGYLPTHNRNFSHPQGEDPVWRAAHCRNRRIFDDRVGLKAGRNTRPFLLQVYRRDMGGGTFVMMKDLWAPILLRGRHRGGVRLAYRS